MTLAKTEAGQRVLKDRSVALTPGQRTAFILIDGKKTAAQVVAAAGITHEDLDKLVQLGLVVDSAPAAAAAPPAGSAGPATATAGAPAKPAYQVNAERLEAKRSERTPQERYADAYPIATRLTSGLGLRGFRLNLAVEGATSFMDLLALAPRIREAVGDEKYAPLDQALNG